MPADLFKAAWPQTFSLGKQCLCSTASEEQYNEVCVYDSTLESLDSRPYKLPPHTHKGHRVRGRVC